MSTGIERMLSEQAGEEMRLVRHSSGPVRFAPVGDPASSCNAALWRARGRGGWIPDAPDAVACAAANVAFRLGIEQGRREAVPAVRVTGKVEKILVRVVEDLAAGGAAPLQDAVLATVVAMLAVPTDGRDRRRERVQRALRGLAKRGVLVATDGRVTTTHAWQAASGAR